MAVSSSCHLHDAVTAAPASTLLTEVDEVVLAATARVAVDPDWVEIVVTSGCPLAPAPRIQGESAYALAAATAKTPTPNNVFFIVDTA